MEENGQRGAGGPRALPEAGSSEPRTPGQRSAASTPTVSTEEPDSLLLVWYQQTFCFVT